jgi:hypothetical protein
MTKREKITYWVLTALFLLPMAGSGIPEVLVEHRPRAGVELLESPWRIRRWCGRSG